jgi:ferric-dicitrate binding protein FerR (iron transport regulator)
VEQRPQGLVVTVSEGKVAVLPNRRLELDDRDLALPLPVNSDAAASGESHAASTEPASLILTAGQQVAVPRAGRMGAVRKVDSERELAWAAGRLDFRDEQVGAVIERFNLYNRVQLVVADEKLAHRTVSGVFDASDPESFIAFLATVTPMRVLRRGDETIMLLPAGEPDERMTQEQ